MALKPFSVIGEALQFSMRRFETVFRVAALPLSLLLIFNMAATFGYLSVANERIITFHDVAAAGANWGQVAQLGANAAQKGLAAASRPIWAIYGASLLINLILVSSFMAPLIRYAGLGERPAPGVMRLPFGADQLRFLMAGVLSTLIFLLVVYAPISFATFSIIGFISQAMTTPFAHFPNPESLHTIEVIGGADLFGFRWLYHYQVWGAWALAAAALLIALLVLHLRPRRSDPVAGIGFIGRALGVTIGVAMYLSICVIAYVMLARLSSAVQPAAGVTLNGLAVTVFFAAAIAFAGFFSLRLFPYAGVAACRRSMAFSGALKVTRRYNLMRLALAFVLLGVLLFGAQILLVGIGGSAAFAVTGYLAAAVESVVRLINGPESGKWVFPFFGWIWAVIGIVFTLVWTAFTYGVTAGLWGRLYRESAREQV
jgi:hypothetical protein